MRPRAPKLTSFLPPETCLWHPHLLFYHTEALPQPATCVTAAGAILPGLGVAIGWPSCSGIQHWNAVATLGVRTRGTALLRLTSATRNLGNSAILVASCAAAEMERDARAEEDAAALDHLRRHRLVEQAPDETDTHTRGAVQALGNNEAEGKENLTWSGVWSSTGPIHGLDGASGRTVCLSCIRPKMTGREELLRTDAEKGTKLPTFNDSRKKGSDGGRSRTVGCSSKRILSWARRFKSEQPPETVPAFPYDARVDVMVRSTNGNDRAPLVKFAV